jgi:Uma2 family endonuclease
MTAVIQPSHRLAPQTLPLQSGDRLTRAEFERRYDAMPKSQKAELINGRVYMASPVHESTHGTPHILLSTWFGVYCASTPQVTPADNTSLRLDMDNEPQPDVYLRIAPECGGRTRIDTDKFVAGGPELVAEVAASSASYDLHDKLNVYRRNGVPEYLVWRTYDQEIDWFVLRDGKYVPLAASADGIRRSEIFPGLWLDSAALLAGNLAKVLEVLQQGLASPAHAEFVARLKSQVEKPATR